MSSKYCQTGYYRLVISLQSLSIMHPYLKVRMMHLVTISEVSSSERISEENFNVLKSPSVAILITHFCNDI